MITNTAGEVAIAYYQPAQVYVDASRVPSGRAYVFTVQRAVSMTWVLPGDVETILAMRKTCVGCGNKPRQLFNYATEGQANMWQYGTRGGPGGDTGCGC